LLKDVLGAGKLASWLEQAKNFAERDDIVDFLKKLKSKFEIFCMEHDI